MSEWLGDGRLIAIVLGAIAFEFCAMALLAWRRRRPALLRQMLPGTCAGLFLVLALRSVHAGDGAVPLWLAGAGLAHGLDWWLRARA